MQAIRIHAFEPDNLRLESVDSLQPGPGEVLIRNQAAGVNPIDWKTCMGGGASGFIESFPWTPGWEFSGEVAALGEGVTEFSVGDTVLGFIRFPHPAGCYAEEVIAPASEITLRPEGLEATTAAGLGLAGLTAWQALFDKGQLVSGEKLLVLAGAGGVGHLAIQLAKAAGAEVTATSSTKNHAYLKDLGCDTVLNYQQLEMASLANQFDLILDGVGADTGIDALIALKPNGRMVTLPSVTAAQVAAAAEGTDVTVLSIRAEPNALQLAELANRVAKGELKLKVAQVLPLSQAADAHRLSASGHVSGKLILQI
ncbi:NADP-dependent oxidoreductase [Nitrincola schmidtii]|uniref:NADP-dependent oxidoreductase n=1 Tax=Nitrincola schmidtii TaxID=1730894 RepID=UPI00124F26AC|nr:NADP-dependent oxidoreductase [Nitrincola schmidtii]